MQHATVMTEELTRQLIDAGIDLALVQPFFHEGTAAITEKPPGVRFESALSFGDNSVAVVGYKEGEAIIFCIPKEAPEHLVSDDDEAPLTPGDRQMEADRQWFEANPDRIVRVRKHMKGEYLGGRTGRWVVVFQVQPGARFRMAFPGRKRPSEEEAEAFARETEREMRERGEH